MKHIFNIKLMFIMKHMLNMKHIFNMKHMFNIKHVLLWFRGKITKIDQRLDLLQLLSLFMFENLNRKFYEILLIKKNCTLKSDG